MISCSFITWTKYGRIGIFAVESGSEAINASASPKNESLEAFMKGIWNNEGKDNKDPNVSTPKDAKTENASIEATARVAEALKQEGYAQVKVLPKLAFTDPTGKPLPPESVSRFYFKPKDRTQVEKGRNGSDQIKGYVIVNGERQEVKTDFMLLRNFWANDAEAKLFDKRDIVYEDSERYNHGRIYPGSSLRIRSKNVEIDLVAGDQINGADIWFRDTGNGQVSVLFIDARGNERYWVTRGTVSINDLHGVVTPPTLGQEIATVEDGVLKTLKKDGKFTPVNLGILMPPVVLPPDKKR